jgi:twitching motility protein PilI
MFMTSTAPFELLRSIEVRSQTRALGIPQQIEVRRTWSGIGYRMGGVFLVSPMGDVSELLDYPTLTRVPGSKTWLKGIANVRGMLLPIVDLNSFITGTKTELQKRSRVLVIHIGEMSCGLVIDEILGLRHFFEEEKIDYQHQNNDEIKKFLVGGYKQGNVDWGIFSFKRLAEHPRFMEVAARS